MSEFDLISQYFKSATAKRNDVVLGIGDDCALLSPPAGKQLAVSTDTLIAGVHFPLSTDAADIGYKSLAVNLSDLAAMGAEPAWVSLAISLPEVDHAWLKKFMHGFTQLTNQFNVSLVGGDTTRGAMSITISVTGFVSEQEALKRSNANPGDLLFVSGTIGDAHAGLQMVLNDIKPTVSEQYCIDRLNRPQPRVEAGQLLARYTSAAIDISDGLLVDLGHVCTASKTGALIYLDKLPLSNSLLEYYNQQPDWEKILTGGDDYELCFTCAEKSVNKMKSDFEAKDIQLTHIGYISDSLEVRCLLNETEFVSQLTGYNHFKNEK